MEAVLCRKCFYGGKVGHNLNIGCNVCLFIWDFMFHGGKWEMAAFKNVLFTLIRIRRF